MPERSWRERPHPNLPPAGEGVRVLRQGGMEAQGRVPRRRLRAQYSALASVVSLAGASPILSRFSGSVVSLDLSSMASR